MSDNWFWKTKPRIGQRCIVWDVRYKQAIFAYWERDNRFHERKKGEDRIVMAGFWMPEPSAPSKEQQD